jgi:hypothetical protein
VANNAIKTIVASINLNIGLTLYAPLDIVALLLVTKFIRKLFLIM